MTRSEARELVASMTHGRTLEVRWDGPAAYSALVVRRGDAGELVGAYDEIPYDVQSPWPATVTRRWDEAELVELLASLPNAAAKLTD